jgi:hypothetical protein
VQRTNLHALSPKNSELNKYVSRALTLLAYDQTSQVSD